MPQALHSGVPSSASLHSGVLFTLHDAHVLPAAAAAARDLRSLSSVSHNPQLGPFHTGNISSKISKGNLEIKISSSVAQSTVVLHIDET